MQEDRKETVKSKDIRRTHDTSEVKIKYMSNKTFSGCTTSRFRSMMPDDIQMQKIPIQKINVQRQSIMPSQQLIDCRKKMDTECKELELGLLYDEYLQTVMMDLIIKKKIDEKKHLVVVQLATIAQEIDQDMKKLIKIKTRERDVINLSLEQKEIDAQLAAVTKYIKDETSNNVKDILYKLQSLLEPLDILRCNAIILPKAQDDWKKIQEALRKCSNILKDIVKVIGSKDETYCAVNDGLSTFTEIYNEVESLQKKLGEALCNLQVLILKNASFSLTHSKGE